MGLLESQLSTSKSDTGGVRDKHELRRELTAELSGSRHVVEAGAEHDEDDLRELPMNGQGRLSTGSWRYSGLSQQPTALGSATKFEHAESLSKLSLVSQTPPVDTKTVVSMLQRLSTNASREELAVLRMSGSFDSDGVC